MTKNPFSPRHPIDSAYFVNREEILESFSRAIKRSANSVPRKPDNIAVLGGWGIGKTSVLKKFESLAVDEFTDLKAFTAFIELNPSACQNIESFITRTRDDIQRSFLSELPLIAKIKRELSDWRVNTLELGIGLERKEKMTESHATSLFEEALRDLWNNILEPKGIEVAMLMFDDLHYLARNYPNGLYDIRSIFQKLAMDGCNYMLFVTGPETLFGEIREFAEPFTRFFERFKLNLFDLEETRKAIQNPLQLSGSGVNADDAVIERIHDLTQGHPYFIHFIMCDLVDYREKGRITGNFFNEHWKKIATHIEREKFEDDLFSASETERKALHQIAELPSDVVSPSEIRIKGKAEILKRLSEDKGLLIKSGRGEYKLYHPLFKEYLKQLKV